MQHANAGDAPAAPETAPSATARPRSSVRYLALDLCRGLAALSVLLSHWYANLAVPAMGHSPPLWTLFWRAWAFLQPPGSGHPGVTFFILLSGYCIHRPLALKRQANPSATLALARFFKRRLIRLYPAYLAAVVLSVATTWFVLRSGRDAHIPLSAASISPGNIAAHLLMVHNLSDRTFDGLGNGPLWSIAMEVQLYALYPLMLLLVARIGWGRVLGLTTVAGLALPVLVKLAGHPISMAIASSTVFYLPGWLFGAWLAEVSVPRPGAAPSAFVARRGLLLAGTLAVMLGTQGVRQLHYIHEYAFFVLVGLLVVALVGAEEAGTYRPGPLSRALAGVGLFSYSLYLVHQPLLNVINVGLVPHGALASGLIGAALIPLAWLFYRAFEQPFLKLAARA